VPGRFGLDTRKRFCTERGSDPGTEGVDAPGLSVSQRHLDSALSNVLELLVSPKVLGQVNRMVVVSPFQLKLFYSILKLTGFRVGSL